MALDTVPWFVGGGAQHSPEVARLLAYAALGGKQGVISAGDLKVSALSTPGAGVRVGPGAAAVLNRASGGSQQAYIGRNTADETVAISATDSSGGRSDLVILRVEDPFLAGEPWPDPEDPTVGPYVFFRVLTGVPPTTTSLFQYDSSISGIALARIDIPANTATITDEMITDLRFLANPRRQRQVLIKQPSTADDLTSSNFVDWPVEASWSINVPSWATIATLTVTLSAIQVVNASVFGAVRAALGGTTTRSVTFDFDIGTGASIRQTFAVADTLSIPSSMRGTTQTLKLQGQETGVSGALEADTGTAIVADIEFQEAPA